MVKPLIQYGRFSCFSCSLFMLGMVSHASAQDVVGPIVGAVETTSANLLYRGGDEVSKFRLSVLTPEGEFLQAVEAKGVAEHDFVARFRVDNLKPATEYHYQIEEIGDQNRVVAKASQSHSIRTVNLARNGNSVTAAFVSCVDIEPNGIWKEMAKLNVDAVCLMGDTPYIDNTTLAVANQKHRQFLQMPDLASLASSTPMIGTWDDHDFGRNNGNGRNMAAGKANTLAAFKNYRAHAQFGNGTEGVYHKIDLGMMEIFLLDPRYFSQVERSPVDATQPTCFGTDQWQWLLKGLRESKAPFKVLSMGAIWEDKKNRETDDLFTYWYERDALLNMVKTEGISGVSLLGGDIHVSRHLIHPQRVGYDLHDFVISPGHQRTITELDVYHPSLEWSLVEGWQFLTLTADGTGDSPRLVAEFRQPSGIVNRRVVLGLDELTPAASDDSIHRELRVHWSFDQGLENDSVLGSRIDAQSHRGANVETNAGVHGDAAHFTRSNEQFLSVPRSFLDETSVGITTSVWVKPESLPKHGTKDRHFILESTAEGDPSPNQAWHLSLGLRSCSNASQVNVQLYTETLRPAAKPEAAPTALSQGPFDLLVDRDELLDHWTQIAWTFDAKSLRIFVNGKLAKVHALQIHGPSAEFGGLIIGGHRDGQGRNYDGWIDELAIWNRVLSDDEIAVLFRKFANNSPKSK